MYSCLRKYIPVRRQEIANVVGDGLCIRGRSGATGVYVIVQRGDLVTHAVGHVSSGRRPRVCSHDDPAVVLDGHDCRLSGKGVYVPEGNAASFKPPQEQGIISTTSSSTQSNLSQVVDVAMPNSPLPTYVLSN